MRLRKKEDKVRRRGKAEKKIFHRRHFVGSVCLRKQLSVSLQRMEEAKAAFKVPSSIRNHSKALSVFLFSSGKSQFLVRTYNRRIDGWKDCFDRYLLLAAGVCQCVAGDVYAAVRMSLLALNQHIFGVFGAKIRVQRNQKLFRVYKKIRRYDLLETDKLTSSHC